MTENPLQLLPLQLLIATSNSGKIREIEEALLGLPITPRYLAEFPDLSSVEEVGETYEENAVLKALGYSSATGLYALADDSGLEVDALKGKPGVRSARFGGEHASDADRTAKLLREISGYPDRERSARFVCCMAIAGNSPADSTATRVLHVSEGICEGLIAQEPLGTNGFGYDPVFIPAHYQKTFGELTPEVKATLSHRAKALAAMRQFLAQFWQST